MGRYPPILLGILGACAGGCAHGAPASTGPKGSPDAAATAFARRVGAYVETHPDQAPWVIRRNPVSCACPAWEVRVEGAWIRCAIEPGDDDVARALDDVAAGATARVIAEASSKLARCPGSEAPVVELEVEAVIPSENPRAP